MGLIQLLAHGGWIMYLIYLVSILALAIFLYKWYEIYNAKPKDIGWVDSAIKAISTHDSEALAQICSSTKHPAAKMTLAISNALSDKPEFAQREAIRVGNIELQKLEKHLGGLSFLSQVTPLLGLLGTVIGMVQMFMGLQAGSQGSISVENLAAGIWTALLTTAAGLSVAVPTLAGYNYLESKTENLRYQFSDIAERMLYAASKRKNPDPVKDADFSEK